MQPAVASPAGTTAGPDRRSSRLTPVMRLLIVVMLALGVGATSAAVAPHADAASARLTDFDFRMLELVNNARTSAGLPALQAHTGLTNLSLYWSGQLADGATNYVLQHNPNAFQQTLSYGASNRTAWAENVAKWSPVSVTADAIFNAYWNSAGHKANIMGASYRYVGIASVTAANGASFNTMTFTDKVDRGDVVDWQKTAYSPTIYALAGGYHHAATYAEWTAAGTPTPHATVTDFVHYPWSADIYAVTFWPDVWQWDKLDFNSWAAAGYPAPRTAGWIAGSTIWKRPNAPDIFITDPVGATHALTYAEWQATNFMTPTVRAS